MVLVGPAHPYRGGIAQFNEEMARGLEARGHAVEVVTFSRQYPQLLFPGTTQYVPDPAEASVRAVRLIDTINPLSWWGAARHIARRMPDTVVFQHWMPFFAPAYGTIARFLRRRGIPSLAVVHNALPHERRPGDRLLSRFFLRACAGFVVMSEAVEADLRALGAAAPVRRVVHPVYDRFGTPEPQSAARRALGLPPEAPVLLFFGFVRRYKGLHVLLEALPQVAAALPDVHLVVAGAFYDDEAPYRAQVRRCGLEEHVHVHAGYVPDEAVSRYFAAADVVVQPYLSATQSGVAQVAFHFDKPLITTDVGGLAEIVPHEEAGLVVPPGDPQALARSIVRFFASDLKERLTEGVRRRKEAHRSDALYEALLSLP